MTDKQHYSDLADTLSDLREQIGDLIDHAESIMRDAGGTDEARAKSYWIAHIKAALGGYGYSSMCSMLDSISDLYAEATNEDDREEK